MSKFLDYGGLQTYNTKVKTKIDGVASNLSAFQSQTQSDLATLAVLANSKSEVSVSGSGTSTNEVKYITVNGTQYKLPAGGGTIPTITLNGSATTTPTFYAPTTSGTANQILKSNGANKAPTYVPYYGLAYGAESPTTMDLNSSSKTGTGSIHYIAKTADYKYARVKFMVRTYYNGTGYWNLYIQKNESATSTSAIPSLLCVGANSAPSSSSYMIITGSYSRAHEVYLDAIVNISNATGTSTYVTFRCGFQTNASSTTTEIRYLGYEKFN